MDSGVGAFFVVEVTVVVRWVSVTCESRTPNDEEPISPLHPPIRPRTAHKIKNIAARLNGIIETLLALKRPSHGRTLNWQLAGEAVTNTTTYLACLENNDNKWIRSIRLNQLANKTHKNKVSERGQENSHKSISAHARKLGMRLWYIELAAKRNHYRLLLSLRIFQPNHFEMRSLKCRPSQYAVLQLLHQSS